MEKKITNNSEYNFFLQVVLAEQKSTDQLSYFNVIDINKKQNNKKKLVIAQSKQSIKNKKKIVLKAS